MNYQIDPARKAEIIRRNGIWLEYPRGWIVPPEIARICDIPQGGEEKRKIESYLGAPYHYMDGLDELLLSDRFSFDLGPSGQWKHLFNPE